MPAIHFFIFARNGIPYFPVYKRPFFGLNFYFKNRGSLIHWSTGVFHLMYPTPPPLMYHGIFISYSLLKNFFPELLPKN